MEAKVSQWFLVPLGLYTTKKKGNDVARIKRAKKISIVERECIREIHKSSIKSSSVARKECLRGAFMSKLCRFAFGVNLLFVVLWLILFRQVILFNPDFPSFSLEGQVLLLAVALIFLGFVIFPERYSSCFFGVFILLMGGGLWLGRDLFVAGGGLWLEWHFFVAGASCVFSLPILKRQKFWLLALTSGVLAFFFFDYYVVLRFPPASLLALPLCANLMVLLGALPMVRALASAKVRSLFILNGVNSVVQLASLIGLIIFVAFPPLPQELMFLHKQDFNTWGETFVIGGLCVSLSLGCCCAVYKQKRLILYSLTLLMVVFFAIPGIGKAVYAMAHFINLKSLDNLEWLELLFGVPWLAAIFESYFSSFVMGATTLLNLAWGRFAKGQSPRPAVTEIVVSDDVDAA